MSNRSFISRAAEERRQRLVVGRVVAQDFAACLVGRFERIEHRVDSLIRIRDLALPLHRIEIIHVGQIGLFIVAEQTHRISYSTTFGTRKKWSSVAGAFLTTSSAISPSMTTSGRFFIAIAIPFRQLFDECQHGIQLALQMRNLCLSDRDPREMRDTANGGDIDGHYIGPLMGKLSPPYSRGGFCAPTGGARPQPAIGLSRASAAPASARVSSAAGSSRPSRTACPAQRLVKSTLPSFSAAALRGAKPVAAWGNAGASPEIGPTSRITRLGTPRAGRPVITLVMTVESSRA